MELYIVYPVCGKCLKAFIQYKHQFLRAIWPSCLDFKICHAQLGQFGFPDSDRNRNKKQTPVICKRSRHWKLRKEKWNLKLWCSGKRCVCNNDIKMVTSNAQRMLLTRCCTYIKTKILKGIQCIIFLKKPTYRFFSIITLEVYGGISAERAFSVFGKFLGVNLWAVVCRPQPITAWAQDFIKT